MPEEDATAKQVWTAAVIALVRTGRHTTETADRAVRDALDQVLRPGSQGGETDV